jgi:hypothetical protein
MIAMVLVREGHVEYGQIVVPHAVELPDGTPVRVSIEVVAGPDETSGSRDVIDHAALPSFGMWADRSEMTNSVAWVNRQRDAWRHRNETAD